MPAPPGAQVAGLHGYDVDQAPGRPVQDGRSPTQPPSVAGHLAAPTAVPARPSTRQLRTSRRCVAAAPRPGPPRRARRRPRPAAMRRRPAVRGATARRGRRPCPPARRGARARRRQRRRAPPAPARPPAGRPVPGTARPLPGRVRTPATDPTRRRTTRAGRRHGPRRPGGRSAADGAAPRGCAPQPAESGRARCVGRQQDPAPDQRRHRLGPLGRGVLGDRETRRQTGSPPVDQHGPLGRVG